LSKICFPGEIQETARKMNVKVEFVKTEKELLDRIKENGEEKPSLIIFDLNNANAKPLTTIPRLKAKLKKGTSFLGFLSHIQGELKMKPRKRAATWSSRARHFRRIYPRSSAATVPARKKTPRSFSSACGLTWGPVEPAGLTWDGRPRPSAKNHPRRSSTENTIRSTPAAKLSPARPTGADEYETPTALTSAQHLVPYGNRLRSRVHGQSVPPPDSIVQSARRLPQQPL